jgi:nucleotide-binding universal stress UspA family protein
MSICTPRSIRYGWRPAITLDMAEPAIVRRAIVRREETMTNPMKILIGYDGSSCADIALDDLRRAGLPPAVEAIVLSVADVLIMPTDAMAAHHLAGWVSPRTVERTLSLVSQLMGEAHAHAKEGAQRLQALFPDWQVHAQACGDSPGWAIISKAREWPADLILVGSHGRSTVARLVLGSVSQTVVTHAPCSVRVARQGRAEPGRPLRILIGVDGSAAATAAVCAVAARDWPPGSDARIVTAIDAMLLTGLAFAHRPSELWSECAEPDELTRVHQMVDAAADSLRLRAPQLAVSTYVKAGDPKRILIEEAERWGADSLFVGAHGLTGWQRLWLGSVSAAVAARSHCSVEIVRSPAATPTES